MTNGDQQTDQMTATYPSRRIANDVEPGHLVIQVGDAATVFLKAEKEGKEFVHHYLLPLQPCPSPADCGLIHLDPDDLLIDLGPGWIIVPDDAGAAGTAAVGDLFETAAGLFLKINDTEKSQRQHTYLEVASGMVRRRQERGVIAVFGRWRVDGPMDLAAALAAATAV